jgi:hypothetical protein
MDEEEQHSAQRWVNWPESAFDFTNFVITSGEEKLQSPILSIENMDRHKGGVYICQANNGVGKPASSQVVLHVLCE